MLLNECCCDNSLDTCVMLRTIHDPLGLTQRILRRNVDLHVDDPLYWQPRRLRLVLIQLIRTLEGWYFFKPRHTKSCRVPQVDVCIDDRKCDHSLFLSVSECHLRFSRPPAFFRGPQVHAKVRQEWIAQRV